MVSAASYPTVLSRRWIPVAWLFGTMIAAISFVVPWKPAAVLLFLIGASAATTLTFRFLNDRLYFRMPTRLLKPLTVFLPLWLTLGIYIFPNYFFRLYVIAGSIAGFVFLPVLSGGIWFLFERTFLRMSYKDFANDALMLPLGGIGLCLFAPGIAERYGRRLAASLRTEAATRGPTYLFGFFDSYAFRRHSPSFEDAAMLRSQAIFVFLPVTEKADCIVAATWQKRLRTATGHFYVIFIAPFGTPVVLPPNGRGLTYFSFTPTSERQEQTFVTSFASHILEDVRFCITPIGDADDEMDEALRETTRFISSHGITPIANAYLRFRLSRSNVERFLSSLDCLELLIKFTTICLLSTSWYSSRANSSVPDTKWLIRPTLGTWITYLRQFVADESLLGPLTSDVRACFQRPPYPLALEAMVAAERIGLVWEGKPPTSQMDWLNWLLWLRNVTRGHGAVDEARVATLWTSLISVFLQMAMALQDLFIQSVMGAPNNFAAGGWDRTILKSTDWIAVDSQCYSPVFLRMRKGVDNPWTLLHPFVLQRDDSFLVWNSVRGDSIEYMNYASGEVLQVTLESANPHQLWKGASTWRDELPNAPI